jgi:putative PIN family toxin of toxin-antitoxin system
VIRVTADTNILVSGIIFPRGKPFQLLELAREEKISLTISAAILDEMAEVLSRKFNFPPEAVEEARRRIQTMARTVTPSVRLDVVKEDPPDDRVLECAVSSGADYIVTGDKDLLRLGRYDAIPIVSVADFLEVGRV